MSRLIDPIALKQSLAVSAILEDGQHIFDIIDAQPTIEERKKGKWIIDGECVDCSVCRHDKWSRVPFEDLVKRFNFCPNCGADMRGEE